VRRRHRRGDGQPTRSIGFATPFSLARDITRQTIASGRVINSRRTAPAP
jgi:hypothetical protein